ncbi:DUF4157 domain-containing protein [Streptomyces sp. BP-8]|uniref:DUF4157 domain-containing protein n=1 Tax=Streptomyces sirii TaxID=3127701 RepID=A0ABZ2QR72_9ACTN
MSTAQSSTQDTRSAAEDRRRKRRERSGKARAPEPKDIVSGAGQPLDLSVRRELEEQLGHDFSQVRLHTDRDSGQLAEMMGADAFAVGQDIFFREGTYRPGTADGQRLLAHELLHTVQNPHGLGALRAGRDLGAVSLPQEAVEREAESAAQASVLGALRGSVRQEEPATEIEPGQATPGWLRYATVHADRARMEKVDPATLVDRLANGVLRSLRGDPEDLSGRVRWQLAGMAPQVQESVLDRLTVRLLSPEVDRLLELVEEVEAGPLPLAAATAPEPVPDPVEVLGQERTQQAAAARDERVKGEKERDGRRKRAQQRKDADPAGDGGEELGGRPAAGGGAKAPAAAAASSGSGQSAAQDRAATDARQKEQAEAKEQDKAAAGQAERKDKESAADGKGEDSPERSADQAAENDGQGADGERAEEAAEEGGTEPAAVDKSAAEPGEKDRKGGDRDEQRRAGDPENEEDADDEPLGLEEESAELDEDDEGADEDDLDAEAEGDDAADSDDSDDEGGPSGDDLDTSTPSAAKQKNDKDGGGQRKSGDGAPGVIDSPAAEDPTAAALRDAEGGVGGGARSPEEEKGSADRLGQDLQTDKSIEQEIGPEPDEKAEEKTGEESGERGSEPADPDDAEAEGEQAEERKEDAEAKRRDDAARTATESTGGPGSAGGGDTAAPGKLSKADEDARKQSTGSASGSSSSSSSSAPGSDAAAGSGDGKSTEGSGDKDVKSSGGSGEKSSGAAGGSGTGTGGGTGTGSGSGTDTGAASGTDKAAGGTASGGSRQAKDDTAATEGTDAKSGAEGKDADAAPAAGEPQGAARSKEVTEGKGQATTPGSETGPDATSAPGPAAAPRLSPGSGTAPHVAAAAAKGGGDRPEASAKPAPGKPPARPKAGTTPKQRQTARQAAKNVRRGSGGGGGGGTAPAPARGGRGGGGGATSTPAKPKREAPPPDVSKSTPEAGLATVSRLKPYQMLETFKGVNGAVDHSVGKERSALRKAPPKMERPIGSPRTVPGGPRAAAAGTYTKAKVSRTDAPKGKTEEITGEQRPEGETPGSDVPEPSWWDILLTLSAAILKKIFPFDDLIDSIMGLKTTDEGLKGNRVGNAPGLPLQDDSDPQRTDEQSQKLDERKDELHRSGREDAAKPMGEDQIFPDAPHETLTAKVPGGKKGGAGKKSAGGPKGGVPVESASAVAEHDRGPQIQAGFSKGRHQMTKERRAKDDKAKSDKQKHDRDLKREVDASTNKQARERKTGQDEVTESRDKWRKEQDDKVAEVDGKKGKKYDRVRQDIDKRQKETDDKADKRTEEDNNKIDNEHTNARNGAEKKKEEKKKEAEKGDGGFLDQLKEWWEGLKKAIKNIFDQAREAVSKLIDKFKEEVFKFIDKARNWVIDQINDFADTLIEIGDDLLAGYPAMQDKWRNTINAGRDYAVKKVNEAADALKVVAGKLIDGLGSALLDGLDMLESGLNAAVEVAENVTVAAVEFGKGVVEGLGEWAAIFNDIVSDPGDWISKAGSAARTGAREYLFDEVTAAVKKWFNNKVQEITGLSPEDFQALIDGDVTVEEMGKMAWDAAVPQLPLIIGELVIEKVVAKLIPGAGWVMAIIDALKTAWDTLSEILAAFGLFMDFLKAVKSGNAARPFAKAVAAGVVALLELIYQALIDGVQKFMGKVTSKLGGMLKNIRKKKHPGGDGRPDEPGAPGKPGHHDKPGQADRPANANRPGPTADKPGPTDKPNQRPVPRKPSPDKTSRPDDGPRPTKHPSPEKKPRPEHQPKHKKKPDEHERREDGREVNAARRRARAAQRKQHDDDKPNLSKRRGQARDTLRKKDRADKKRDEDKTKNPLHKKKQDDKGHKKPDLTKDKNGKKKVSTKKTSRRKPESRTRRKLRRARQTIKSALNRARRAARRLLGKGRKLGHKLNNRTRRLRNQWRRQRDRLRRQRERRRDRNRNKNDKRSDETTQAPELPSVRFHMHNGEIHTLLFNGRSKSANLVVHSELTSMDKFFAGWLGELASIDDPQEKESQEKAREEAMKLRTRVDRRQDSLAPINSKPVSKERPIATRVNAGQYEELRRLMTRLGNLMAQRNASDSELPPTIFPPFANGVRAPESTKAHYLQQASPPGEAASVADERPGNPLGYTREMHDWPDVIVRMHLLTEKLGGLASGSNLVPAPSRTNSRFNTEIESEANKAARKTDRSMIWYTIKVDFHPGRDKYFPSRITMMWNGYDRDRAGANKWIEQKPRPDRTYSENIRPPRKPDGKHLIHVNDRNESKTLIREAFGDGFPFAGKRNPKRRAPSRWGDAVLDSGPHKDTSDLVGNLESYEKKQPKPKMEEFRKIAQAIWKRDAEGRIAYE